MKRTLKGLVDIEFYGDSDIRIGNDNCGRTCRNDTPDEARCIVCLLESLDGKNITVTVEWTDA